MFMLGIFIFSIVFSIALGVYYNEHQYCKLVVSENGFVVKKGKIKTDCIFCNVKDSILCFKCKNDRWEYSLNGAEFKRYKQPIDVNGNYLVSIVEDKFVNVFIIALPIFIIVNIFSYCLFSLM